MGLGGGGVVLACLLAVRAAPSEWVIQPPEASTVMLSANWLSFSSSQAEIRQGCLFSGVAVAVCK